MSAVGKDVGVGGTGGGVGSVSVQPIVSSSNAQKPAWKPRLKIRIFFCSTVTFYAKNVFTNKRRSWLFNATNFFMLSTVY
jgi:hypothetical protein